MRKANHFNALFALQSLAIRLNSIYIFQRFMKKIKSQNIFREFMKGKTLKLFKISRLNIMKTKISHQVMTEVKRKCLKVSENEKFKCSLYFKVLGQKPLSKNTCLKFMRKASQSNAVNVQQSLVLKVKAANLWTLEILHWHLVTKRGLYQEHYEKVLDKDHVWSPSAYVRSQVFKNLQPSILAYEDWLYWCIL